jgi:hypothetical protein
MYARVITATDCARIEAIEQGDTGFSHYVEEQL